MPRKVDKRVLTRLLKELDKRKGNKNTVDKLLKFAFDKQLEFINDPCRFKALQCSRRSGKSYLAGIYLLMTCLLYPKSKCLYLALTRDSAKRNMVTDIFEELQEKGFIDYKFNKIELTLTFPNKSVIYLLGVDANEKEAAKLRGTKPKLVIIDEAQDFKTDLKDLITRVLGASLVDVQGTICMLGTCGNHIDSFFYNVCNGLKGLDKTWNVYKWTAADNPNIAHLWAADIAKMIEAEPLIVETPAFRQEYLNEWVVDLDRICYKFDRDRNTIDRVPDNKYHYIIGIDTGHTEATAWVVLAYADDDKHLYVVDEYQKTKLIAYDIALKTKKLMDQYNPDTIVIDGQNAIVVEEMRQRYDIPLRTENKQGKNEFIDLVSSDLIMGIIKVVEADTRSLQKEWMNLIWANKGGKRFENPSCPNHLADAMLYAWRHAYNYTSREGIKKGKLTDVEFEAEQIAREEQYYRNKENIPWYERQ